MMIMMMMMAAVMMTTAVRLIMTGNVCGLLDAMHKCYRLSDINETCNGDENIKWLHRINVVVLMKLFTTAKYFVL